MAETYTPEQQAEFQRKYPNMEWINGQPYTRRPVAQNIASYAADGTPLDYLGQPVVDTGETELVPAELTTRFPWEAIALMAGAPAAVAGIGALAGLGAGAAGGAAAPAVAGGSTAAAAAPAAMYGGLPMTTAMPAVLGGTGAGISAPAVAGGGIFSALTGGKTGAALDLGGRMLSGITGGMAANRSGEDLRTLAQDQMRMQAAGMETATDRDRAQIQIQQQNAAQQEQADAYRKVLQGQMAANMQDVTLDRSGFHSDIPTISFQGGMRPSVIGALGREAGTTLSSQAMDRLQNPTRPEPLPTYNAPALSAPTKASMWEQILSPLAAGGVALGNMNRVTPNTMAPAPQRVG
jgi:hypothetical protein